MQNIMIDLETLGKSPNAAIIAIGAVEFDLDRQLIGSKFYCVVDLDSAVGAGGVMDADTVLWWLRQGDAARKAIYEPEGTTMVDALHLFQKWTGTLGNRKELKVWGNGAAFDNVILASAYRRLEMSQPWLYWNDRCYRTIKNLYPTIPLQRAGIQHNALDDAENQARHLLSLLPGVKNT